MGLHIYVRDGFGLQPPSKWRLSHSGGFGVLLDGFWDMVFCVRWISFGVLLDGFWDMVFCVRWISFLFFLSFFLRKVYFTLFGEKANVDLPLDTRFSVTDVFHSLFFPRTVYFILFGRADWMVEKKCNRLRFQVKKKASKF